MFNITLDDRAEAAKLDDHATTISHWRCKIARKQSGISNCTNNDNKVSKKPGNPFVTASKSKFMI